MERPGEVVVRVTGEVDMANAPDLRARLEAAAASVGSAGVIRVDMRDVSFIDSSGLHVVDRVLALVPHGCMILHASDPVRRVADIVGLLRTPNLTVEP